MRYNKHVEYIFLSAIIGLGGLAVNYIATMSENIHKMTVSMQVVSDVVKDHENRIRDLEKFQSKRQP